MAIGGDLLGHRLEIGIFAAHLREIAACAFGKPGFEEFEAAGDLVEFVEGNHAALSPSDAPRSRPEPGA
ncbi:hypothetical protein GCM10008966_03210 [Rhodovulum strictum]